MQTKPIENKIRRDISPIKTANGSHGIIVSHTYSQNLQSPMVLLNSLSNHCPEECKPFAERAVRSAKNQDTL
jgi:hypothetical protein